MSSLQQSNIARVQELVGEFMAGRPEGYMAGVADDIKGSVCGGLIPGASDIKNKAEFGALFEKMPAHMDVKKFEPYNWRATGDDVLFNVDWVFVHVPTGKEVTTTALVRKVVRDNLICEKYHMLDPVLIKDLTGEEAPHGSVAVDRVKALLAEFQAGKPEGYMAGVADDVKADMLGGLIPGADAIANKEDFAAVMGKMDKFMAVEKFEPVNFRELPNSDMMFNVNWKFTWLATGRSVETTAVVRKVVKEGCITEKYHMCDNAYVTMEESPRGVIASEA